MMKTWMYATVVAFAATPVFAGDLSVSVNIGEPGFYGQINLGGAVPAPQLIFPQPVVVQAAPEFVSEPPIYLHVPPGHEKHWREHCAEYHACGRRVFFVREDWYNREYVPRYHRDHEEHGRDHDHARGEDHDHGHDHGEGHGHGHDDH